MNDQMLLVSVIPSPPETALTPTVSRLDTDVPRNDVSGSSESGLGHKSGEQSEVTGNDPAWFGTRRPHVQIVSPRLEPPVFERTGDHDTTGVAGHPVTCEACGDPYYVVRLRPNRKNRRLCITCRGIEAGKKLQARRISPEADRATRIRANALVNMRLVRGWFTKPLTCDKCLLPKEVGGHHPAYSKPDEVHWLCDECHGKAHYRPGFCDGLIPFVCYDRRSEHAKPKPHGKGGRCGPVPAEQLANHRAAKGNKISPDQLEVIRARVAAGERQVDVGREYGVGQMTVSRLLRGVRVPCAASPSLPPEGSR